MLSARSARRLCGDAVFLSPLMLAKGRSHPTRGRGSPGRSHAWSWAARGGRSRGRAGLASRRPRSWPAAAQAQSRHEWSWTRIPPESPGCPPPATGSARWHGSTASCGPGENAALGSHDVAGGGAALRGGRGSARQGGGVPGDLGELPGVGALLHAPGAGRLCAGVAAGLGVQHDERAHQGRDVEKGQRRGRGRGALPSLNDSDGDAPMLTAGVSTQLCG